MTLRAKLSLLLVFSLLIVAIVTLLTFRLFFLGTFDDLEERQLRQIAAETRSLAIQRIGSVVGTAMETSRRDDVRQFLETGNIDLIWRLVEDVSWARGGADAFAVFDDSGSVLFETGFDHETLASSAFPPGLIRKVVDAGMSVSSEDGDTCGGVVFVGTEAWIVGASEVRPSAGDGPSIGVVIHATLVNETIVDELDYMPEMDIDILAEGAGPQGIGTPGPMEAIRKIGPEAAVVYTTLGTGPGRDIVIEISGPREVYGLGRETADRVMLMVVICGIIFTIVTVLLFQGIVMGPLRVLSARIEAIGESGDPSRRCRFEGDDELADLADTVDDTLDKLERASTDLRQSRMRFELFARFLPGYSFIKRADGRLVYANDGFRRDFLGSREDWEGMQGDEIWSSDLAARLKADDDSVLAAHRPIISELDVPVGGRGVRRLLIHKFPIGPDPAGDILLGGIAIDVTDRARTEEMLLHSEMRYEGILSAIPESVLTVTRQGMIVTFSAGSAPWADMARERLEGQLISSIGLSKDDEIRAMDMIARSLRFRSVESMEVRLAEGPAMGVYECRFAPFENDSVVCTIRNVTEKKRMEMDLLESQKQESLSLMAGGIAHDFRNILSAVTGNIELGTASEPGGKESLACLSSAMEACDKAFLMLRQLEMLSRGVSSDDRIPLDLNELLSSTARLVLSGSKVTLSTSSQQNLWRVQANEGQMVQAFSNFIVNAREAMDGEGNLDVRLWNAMTRSGDREVMISIRDSGPGIPVETLPRIFDPYFSTKARGSGLGLAVTISIIKQHNGRVEVDSITGEGATFTVSLPAG